MKYPFNASKGPLNFLNLKISRTYVSCDKNANKL